VPPFVELFQTAITRQIRFDAMLSDEGGRFYHSQQRHIVIELEKDLDVKLPPNYIWLTLRQIQKFAQFSSQVNIELRSIISCLAMVD
jgi:dTDP-4-dehydro-6-deoxy-alpha-D-glucopyranose 2,3-dehydratase